MEISLYTIPFSVNGTYFLYNSLSNALIEVDAPCYNIFENKMVGDIKTLTQETELFDVLVNHQFLTPNREDQYLSYVAAIRQIRSISDKFHLTIAPTMNCPFRCPYCFEVNKQKGSMSQEIQDGIVAYLKTLPRSPDFHLTWFGGEPLMAMDIINQLYDKIERGYKAPYKSNMITTGYCMDDTVIETLKRINCTELQITLDGLPKTHNKIKRSKLVEDPFTDTLNGIKRLLEVGGFQISIRVNVTKTNSSEFMPLLSLLIQELGFSSNWSYSPGLVLSRGILEKRANDLIPVEEAISFAFDTFAKDGYKCSWTDYPSNLINECAVRNPLSLTLDPEGYMYKCWETIGLREWAFGRISAYGKIEEFTPSVLNRFLYGADHLSNSSCVKCSVHPICHGGCPYNWILNTFKGENRNVCSPYKTSIKDILKHHIKKSEEARVFSSEEKLTSTTH